MWALGLRAAQAAEELAHHLLRRLDTEDLTSAAPAALDKELAALGAAIGANDRTNIERHMTALAALGASPSQIQQALDVAHTVQTNAAAFHLRGAERLLAELPPAETPAIAASPANEGDCGCEARVPLAEAAHRLGHSVEPLVSTYIGAMEGDDTEANALVDVVLATIREAIIVADQTDKSVPQRDVDRTGAAGPASPWSPRPWRCSSGVSRR